MPVRLNPEAAKAWGLALSVGWRIAAGVIIGSWIDKRLETTPIFITVLAIGALVSVISDLVRSSKRSSQSDDGP